MSKPPVLVLLLVACSHPPPRPAAEAPPSLVHGAPIAWFDLHGQDRVDLLESCLDACPHDEDGQAVTSITSWSVDWLWSTAGEPCEVVGATADVDVTVALPRWQPPADADPGLVDEWHGYVDALARHEQGHVDMLHRQLGDAVDAADGRDCAAADVVGAQVLGDLDRDERAYDVQTGHGRSQGAAFWP